MAREITIDGAGRVVIPRDVRERHHLKAGSRLALTDDGVRLVLEPEAPRFRLAQKAGILVVEGTGSEVADHRALREERLDRLAGPAGRRR